MITVNLKGGLGNQMFQYAYGRALSIRNNDRLRLVRTEKSGDVGRVFSLTHFDIYGEIGHIAQVGFLSRLLSTLNQKILRRFYVGFEPHLMNLQGNIYLDGYFQSEKYFVKEAAVIRRELTLKHQLSEEAAHLQNDIVIQEHSVSLHVRRGDYVNHPEFGGIADREYYSRALSEMRRLLENPKIYVFSDDIDWCRENLSLPEGAAYVSNNSLKDYEEMALMSTCKHQIIANSTFSWWAAWLNNNPTKIVIAPKIWSHKHNDDWYRDIIPDKWLRL